ncbi:MAG: right-handed parallel beta-helix repeat-containing protein [Eubacterium sp.]
MKRVLILFISSFLSITLVFLPFTAVAYALENEINVYSESDAVTIPVNGNDISDALDNAFSYCRKHADKNNEYIIKTPQGEFNTTKSICLTSYTTLDMSNGTTLVNAPKGAGNIFLSPNGVGGYEGLVGFSMTGGTLTYADDNKNGNCLVRIAHTRDITFDSVSFTNNYQSHDVEIAGCKNVLFNKCVFDGQNSDLSVTSSEALQIDILEETKHFTKMGPYDGTMNKDIVISECTFKNLVRGLGTHSSYAGHYQSGIKVINNIFENISSTAITFFNYINSEISGNRIINCGQGIHYYMMQNDSNLGKICLLKGAKINTDCNTVISDNTINVCTTENASVASPLYVFGNNVTADKGASFNYGNYYVGGITIKNNNISTTGYGIRLYDVKKSDITENRITRTGKSRQGIFLDASSSNNNISSNLINGFDAAIDLKGGSEKNTISSNEIGSCGGYGIIIQGKSNNSVIKYNSITSSGDNSILLNNSTASDISSNTIVSSKKHGISITESSNVTNINSNSIKNCAQYGIIVQLKSKVTNLNSNTVTSSGKTSLYVTAASNVTNINSNKITTSKQHGISIYDSSTAASIKSNNIKSCAQYGIIVQLKSKITNINSNIVTSSGKTGVYVTTSAVVSNINSNNISSSKQHGISVCNSAAVTDINSNKVKSSASNGIYIDSKSKIKYVKSNTVTGSKNNGISIYGTISGHVISNTLKSNAGNGLYFGKGSKSNIYNNTYSSNKKHKAYSAGKSESYSFANVTKPDSVSIKKKSKTATIKWKKVSGAASYQIFRATSKNGTYTKIAAVSSSKTSYTNSKLKKGKTYYYKIRVIRKMNGITAYSSFSPVKSIKI